MLKLFIHLVVLLLVAIVLFHNQSHLLSVTAENQLVFTMFV